MSGDGSPVSAGGVLAPEARVRVRVNDATTLEWSCTPADLSTLAIGWLVCEGVVRSPDEVAGLTEIESEADGSVRLSVHLAQLALTRLTRALSMADPLSVGPPALSLSGMAEAPPAGSASASLRASIEDRDRVAAWFREMFDGASLRSSVGGVHTGGLVVDGRLVRVVEDVSRHHVVDRLVGSAFLSGQLRPDSIFLVSARISGAMAAKACRAGVGALVSRSVPTELAAAVARSHGLVLVGRARREAPHYFWPGPGPAA